MVTTTMLLKIVWSAVLVDCGEQCVIINGMLMMLKSICRQLELITNGNFGLSLYASIA